MANANLLHSTESRMLVVLRVGARNAEACAANLKELSHVMAEAAGFCGLDVIRRYCGLGTDFIIVARFENADALKAWKSSDMRRRLLADIEAMAINDISRQEVAGSSIWFEPIEKLPGSPPIPLFWKRWAISMLAVYPPLVLLVWALQPITSRMPSAVGLFLIAGVLTGLTTAFIVPWMTRVMQSWLLRR